MDHENLMPIDLAEERGGLRPHDERNALQLLLRVSPLRERWRAAQIRRQRHGFSRRVVISALVFALIAAWLAILPRMQASQVQSEANLPTIKRSLRMHVANVFVA